jgi:hypothetical protein
MKNPVLQTYIKARDDFFKRLDVATIKFTEDDSCRPSRFKKGEIATVSYVLFDNVYDKAEEIPPLDNELFDIRISFSGRRFGTFQFRLGDESFPFEII